MNQLFKFTAYNAQAMFGWGDENEANAYCDFLNRNREINMYSYEEITDDVERYDEQGINLADALQEIADDA